MLPLPSNLRCGEPGFLSRVAALFSDFPFPELEPAWLEIEKFGSELQEASSVRHLMLARYIASRAITDEGKLDLPYLEGVLQILQAKGFSLRPGYEDDAPYIYYLKSNIKTLLARPDLQGIIIHVQSPAAFSTADHLIRATLEVTDSGTLGIADARRAVLTAYLTRLRQVVGSCFATATAILIQAERPESFLRDLDAILATGKMVRRVAGEDFEVPLAPSFGSGDLKKPAPGAFSPIGYVKAFLAAGLLQRDLSLPEQVAKAKELVREHGKETAQGTLASACSAARLPKVARELAETAFVITTENALLRAWEFTLASLSEAKSDLTKWNLFVSLGLNHTQPVSVGQTLYEAIEVQLQDVNADIEAEEKRLASVEAEKSMINQRARRATTQEEQRRISAEQSIRTAEYQARNQKLDELKRRADVLAQLFEHMRSYFMQKLPLYFQEVYDPDIQEEEINQYDDRPAGFALLFKGGRSHAGSWSKVDSLATFSDALAQFFILVERDLETEPALRGLERDLPRLMTSLVALVRTDEFQKAALNRIREAKGGAGTAKPWVYVSGGNPNTLLRAYFALTENPPHLEKPVSDQTDLLVYVLDYLKDAPAKLTKAYIEQPEKAVLVTSPTHLFSLKPGLFSQGWLDRTLSYTWIRDQLVLPQLARVSGTQLDADKVQKLTECLWPSLSAFGLKDLPMQVLGLRRSLSFSHPSAYKDWLMDAILQARPALSSRQVNAMSAKIDEGLYEHTPLLWGGELKDALFKLLSMLVLKDGSSAAQIQELIDATTPRSSEYQVFSSSELRECCKGLFMLLKQASFMPKDSSLEIAEHLAELGYSFSLPLTVADSNWTLYRMGFVLNPGTEKWEFWTFNHDFSKSNSMYFWRAYFSLTKPSLWGLYPGGFEGRIH